MAGRPDQFTLNASHPLAQGLVFAGLGQLPGSTRYHDSSVFGNYGVLTNMEPATDWVWDASLRRMITVFGDSAEYVTRSTLVSSSGYTVAMWMMSTVASSSSYIAKPWINGTTSDSCGFSWSHDNPAYRSAWYHQNASSTYFPLKYSALFAADRWYPVVASWDGSNARLYVDGSLVSGPTSITSVKAQTGNFNFGSQGIAGWTGLIGDPMVWSRGLTDSEAVMYSDPSNVMLSGLINPPRRKWWPVASGAAPSFKSYWANQATQVAM